MISDLIDLMVKEGMKIESPESTMESLSDSIATGQLRTLYKNGIPIGFFTWREIYKEKKQYIWINYLCVKKGFRSKTNLLPLKKFFRTMYPYCEFVYWKSDKHERYFYAN